MTLHAQETKFLFKFEKTATDSWYLNQGKRPLSPGKSIFCYFFCTKWHDRITKRGTYPICATIYTNKWLLFLGWSWCAWTLVIDDKYGCPSCIWFTASFSHLTALDEKWSRDFPAVYTCACVEKPIIQIVLNSRGSLLLNNIKLSNIHYLSNLHSSL